MTDSTQTKVTIVCSAECQLAPFATVYRWWLLLQQIYWQIDQWQTVFHCNRDFPVLCRGESAIEVDHPHTLTHTRALVK